MTSEQLRERLRIAEQELHEKRREAQELREIVRWVQGKAERLQRIDPFHLRERINRARLL